MSYEELSLNAEIIAKALDKFEDQLTMAVLDSGMSAKKETHRAIRHRVRTLRDELREEVVL